MFHLYLGKVQPRSLTLRTFMNRTCFVPWHYKLYTAVSLAVNLGETNYLLPYSTGRASRRTTPWEQNSKPLYLPRRRITLQPPGMAGIHRRNSCTFIGDAPPHTRSCVLQKCFFNIQSQGLSTLSFPSLFQPPNTRKNSWTYSLWLCLRGYSLLTSSLFSLRCYSLSWPFCPPEFYHCSSSSLLIVEHSQ